MAGQQVPAEDQWSEQELRDWIAIDTTQRAKRRYLTDHLTLIDQRSLDFLQRAVATYQDEPAMLDMLQDHARLLQDALAFDGDVTMAVRTAYINRYGGLTIDVPDWLADLEQRFSPLTEDRPLTATGLRSVVMLRMAIERALKERVDDAIVAELHMQFWNVVQSQPGRLEPDDYDRAIAGLEKALDIFHVKQYPMRHAMVLLCLGNAMRGRTRGYAAADIEASMRFYERASAIVSREHSPLLWARLRHSMANALLKRQIGDPAENLDRGMALCAAALEALSESSSPYLWALVTNTLGSMHVQRGAEGQREHVESAIDCFRAALRVFTFDETPDEYAMTQNNLGTAYRHRIAGDPIANAEFSMAAHFEALRVYTKDTYPLDYAHTMCNLASTSLNRPAIDQRVSIMSAIRGFHEALTVYTPDHYAHEYAMTQNNLGIAYSDLPEAQGDDLERAIAAYREALNIYTREDAPVDHARTIGNLGTAYFKRVYGARQDNLEQAVACFRASLSIFTAEAFPLEHRLRQLSIVLPEAECGNWRAVHEAYQAAAAIEERILHLEAGEEARAAIIKEGRDTLPRDGYALVRLGRVPEAAASIDRGRGRELVDTLILRDADSTFIEVSALRERFIGARARFLAAQVAQRLPIGPTPSQETLLSEWNSPHLARAHRGRETARSAEVSQARVELDDVIREIRANNKTSNFLDDRMDERSILEAADALGPGHAIVYLVATPWGGAAVAAIAGDALAGVHSHYASLDLPWCTVDHLYQLAQTRLSERTLHIIGGFVYAQRGSGLKALELPYWRGDTFQARAQFLYEACVGAGMASTLSEAAQLSLRSPGLKDIVCKPLAELDTAERGLLEETLNHLFLKAELKSSMRQLSAQVMKPLGAWLRGEGVCTVTLAPCGFLEAFPLGCVPIDAVSTFADVFPMSVVPNARALLGARDVQHGRHGLCAIGDPYPTPQSLPWGEAEALTVAKLARSVGVPAQARVRYKATRGWLTEEVRRACVVSTSCHGYFETLDYLRSYLLLAHGETLTLAEMLSETIDLRGVRLLILSACQSAVPDVRSQTDEVRSLASGVLQAGARAALASLWPVDDRATYILIVRFAQEWLPVMGTEPPAAALARAQKWMRTASNRKLRAWQATKLDTFSTVDIEGTGTHYIWTPPWRVEGEDSPAHERSLIAVRGRGNRLSVDEAESRIRLASVHAPQNECPFADPIFWAGFQIIGW